jgi:hypothetical protein
VLRILQQRFYLANACRVVVGSFCRLQNAFLCVLVDLNSACVGGEPARVLARARTMSSDLQAQLDALMAEQARKDAEREEERKREKAELAALTRQLAALQTGKCAWFPPRDAC